MGTVTQFKTSRFSIGDLVRHQRFNYRGVIVDIDPTFQLTQEWYDAVASSRPPKDKPWYHVLVDGAAHTTYVAERHLEGDENAEPISHPMLEQFFSRFEEGRYVSVGRAN
jgi:heat shock protein HspQ